MFLFRKQLQLSPSSRGFRRRYQRYAKVGLWSQKEIYFREGLIQVKVGRRKVKEEILEECRKNGDQRRA